MTNVNLGPKESPQDAAQRKAEDEAKAKREAGRDATKALKADLERQEAQQFPGAGSAQPKSGALDARPLEQAKPDKHLRYLNTANKDRMPHRIHNEGYRPVDETEAKAAGVQPRLGNLVLSEQPREVHDRRVAQQKRENERRLRASTDHMDRVVEKVAKELRDKHGIKVDVNRLLVDE